MKRKKIITRNNNGILALKTEWKSGIALLLMLNILLGVVNIIDIQWVWFNFEWEGQYLKQFVHQGTYMLIVSIIISIVVVGFLFRANLNFYKKNKTLKFLAVTFLAQNAVLLFSVGLRNWYYIEHYALAYKRVGVVFFLLITLALLISLAFKITKLKSNYWFVTVNSWSVWIILIVGSYFNWDVIIAKYNANHAGVSFYHFNFMVDRADKSLPYLIMNFDDLKRIETYQNEKFPVHNSYLSAEEYQNKVKHRIWAFKSEWEDKSILEWNYAEYKAYNKLKELDLIEELKNIDSSN